jgi:hypothetical protein
LSWCYGHEGEGRRQRTIAANLLSEFYDVFEFSAFAEVFWMQQELVAVQALAGLMDGHYAGGIPEPQVFVT